MSRDSIRWSENPAYGFAVGRVRSLETMLLDQARYDRLIRTSGAAELEAVVADTVYGRDLSGGGGWSAAISSAVRDNWEFFRAHCREPWLEELFELPRTADRMKARLKAGVGSGARGLTIGDRPPAPSPGRKPLTLPWRDTTAEAALLAYRESNGPGTLDTYIDRATQERALALAAPSDFLTRLFSLRADIGNLRAAIRIKLAGEENPAAALRSTFLPGGALSFHRLSGALDSDKFTLTARFSDPAVRSMAEDVAGGAGLARVERRARELELALVRRTRYTAFGYEPLVAYYLLRENEIGNLRRLHAAKSAGCPESYCSEMVAYVA
jgi:V/A-type H+-transporting ATPase subunit C